ncbi:MAG: N-acetyl sugar amidotransferase [Verrucomicrobia bacterium]|nr:N-acetyl sugar amidotransferase [Verrucomicrobiota bacterium]
MKYCKKCIMPDTRPDLHFDSDGVCDACHSFEKKLDFAKGINWTKRKKEFDLIIQKTRTLSKSMYDCVVPVSGGKDSHLSLYYIKRVYRLNPLCVCFEPTLPTSLGRKNLENIRQQGVDLIHFRQNPVVYEKLILEGFKRVGDMEWANHMGIWSVPVQIAIRFRIPLIVWGESPQLEYGGARTVSETNKKVFNEDWLNDYGCLNGLRPHDLISENLGLTEKDLVPYFYPTRKEVKKWGGKGVFLGYYFPWNNQTNLKTIEKMGWQRKPGRIEVSYTDFEKLDCLSMNLHDYLKFCKYGYGRATDSACIEIRNHKISRAEGVRLAEKYDGRYPKECVYEFCKHFRMSQSSFDKICDQYTNPTIFQKSGNKFKRDIDGSLIMKDQLIKERKNP